MLPRKLKHSLCLSPVGQKIINDDESDCDSVKIDFNKHSLSASNKKNKYDGFPLSQAGKSLIKNKDMVVVNCNHNSKYIA